MKERCKGVDRNETLIGQLAYFIASGPDSSNGNGGSIESSGNGFMVASNVHFSHLMEHDKWPPGPGQGHKHGGL